MSERAYFSLLHRLSLLNFDLNGATELPAGRGPTGKRGWPAGKRGTLEEEHALLAWPGGGLRLCRRGGANMGLRRAGFGAPCWRVPTVDQGFAGGMAPTWAGAGWDSGRPVGVARRWIKALPAGRRQHGPAPSGIRGALLAWPDGGTKALPAGRRQHGPAASGRKEESDVDALVFPPHALTPLSELMHEYPFLHPMHHF